MSPGPPQPFPTAMAICIKYTLKQVELAAKKEANDLYCICGELPLELQPVMAWLKQAAKDARHAYLTCDCECPDHIETQSEGDHAYM